MKYAMCPCGCGLTIEIVGEDEGYYQGRILAPGNFGYTARRSYSILKESNWIIKDRPENKGLEEDD